jgi:hypothetical protein
MTPRDDTLSGALARAAEALRLTATRLSRVETAIGEVMLQAGKPSLSHFADLQELDLSTQEVAALAEFIDRLAQTMPRDMTADLASAARPLTLHDLARFLSRGASATPVPAHGDDDIFFL